MIAQYWFRAIAISLASFALSYVPLSAIAALAWIPLRKRKANSQTLLFALLAGPIVISAATVAFLVLPAFLGYEPIGDESTGFAVRLFGAVGAVIVTTGFARAAKVWWQTLRSVREWSKGAVPGESKADLLILTTNANAPAAVVTGIARPKLLISSSAKRALTPNELRLVMTHELEHARRHDNLRKLLLSANFMPFRKEIEEKWMVACELIADRAAVSNGNDACDLAAALVKVSRLKCVQPKFVMNFAAVNQLVLELRVKSLIGWKPEHKVRHHPFISDWFVAAVGLVSVNVLFFAEHILAIVHKISELWMG